MFFFAGNVIKSINKIFFLHIIEENIHGRYGRLNQLTDKHSCLNYGADALRLIHLFEL